jgi:hypothetical protein
MTGEQTRKFWLACRCGVIPAEANRHLRYEMSVREDVTPSISTSAGNA